VYAFALLAWELLTRDALWKEKKSSEAIVEAVLQDERPEIPFYCPPPYRSAVLNNAWAPRADERPGFSDLVGTLKVCFQFEEIGLKDVLIGGF
jgi:hypothetical protein